MVARPKGPEVTLPLEAALIRDAASPAKMPGYAKFGGFEIHVKSGSAALGCTPAMIGDRLRLKLKLPPDAPREMLIIRPRGDAVFLDSSYFPGRRLPTGATLELDLEEQEAFENVLDDNGEAKRVSLFDRSGQYEFELWKNVQEVDAEDVIPDLVCIVEVVKS